MVSATLALQEQMDSKRKANGNTIALEDVDDRAVKRRKMPVSCALFFNLCGV